MSEESNALADVDLTQTPEVVENENPPKEEEKSEDEPQVKTVDQALGVFPGAPDKAQLETWKQQYGEILCSGFSDTELFVFRPMRRDEFVNLQTVISQAQEPISQFDVEDKIVRTCTMWASPAGLECLENKAGSLSTLHEQILQVSNFMNPALAASFVVRL